MTFRVNEQKCDGCGCCAAVCPADAVRIGEETAHIISTLCKGCGSCALACPVNAISEDKHEA